MNARATPIHRQPDRSAVQKLINEAGRLIGLASSLGALTDAEEADCHAEVLEECARRMGGAMALPSNGLDQMLGLQLAGDYAKRARLYRDRARELRG
jgi:hypothetical protein